MLLLCRFCVRKCTGLWAYGFAVLLILQTGGICSRNSYCVTLCFCDPLAH